MKCHKCGANLTKEDDFCPECGAKVKKEKEKKHKTEVEHVSSTTEIKLSKNKIIIASISIGLLIVALIVVFAIPFPYQATQQYIEKVPYQDTETYYEDTIQYNTNTLKAISEISPDGYKGGWERIDPHGNGEITIDIQTSDPVNILLADSYSWCSNFARDQDYNGLTVGHTYFTKAGITNLKQTLNVKDLTGYDVKNTIEMCFMWYRTYREGSYSVNFDITEKVPYETQVQKNREVTKYKDEYKEKKITKHATLFNRWIGNIKWYYAVGEE